MDTQEFDMEVINDCNYLDSSQFSGYEFKNEESHDQMDLMHRSAPNIHLMHSNYSYGNQADDFMMNSCQNIEKYGHYFNGAQQDISYEQDSQERPFQSEDIFDRINDINFENIDCSLQEEQDWEYDRELKSSDNFQLDSAFNFDLNLNANKNKNFVANSFTDRVSCSLMESNFSSRSQQKNRNGSIMKNYNNVNKGFNIPTNIAFNNGVQFSMFKNKNNKSNKKKFQHFTDYVKQSNILGQILPSNNIQEPKMLQNSKSINQKSGRKSIMANPNIQKNQNKQKLLKKIDKLLFSNSNRKPNQIQKILENRQRKQLKKQNMRQLGKENHKKIEILQNKKKSIQNLTQKTSPFDTSTKFFKRSKNLQQQIKKKQCLNATKMQKPVSQKVLIKKDKENKSKYQGFIYQKDALSKLSKLEQKISAETLSLFSEFNKVYEESIICQKLFYTIKRQENHEISDLSVSDFLSILQLQAELKLKKQFVQKQEKQKAQRIKVLQQKFNSLKNRLDINYLKIQASNQDENDVKITLREQIKQFEQQNALEKNSHKGDNLFIFRNVNKKRQQMSKQFDIWKQLGL